MTALLPAANSMKHAMIPRMGGSVNVPGSTNPICMGIIPQLVGFATQWYNGGVPKPPLHSRHTSGIIWGISPIVSWREILCAPLLRSREEVLIAERQIAADPRLFLIVRRNDTCMHIVANQ